MKNESSKKYYDVLIEERAKLVNSRNRSIEQFDKGILTISTGALVLSITFVNNLVPEPIGGTIKFLIFSWFSFGTCVLITLTSFLTSHQAFSIAIDNLFSENQKKNNYSIATNILNMFSIGFLIAGIIFWAIFILGGNMSNKKNTGAKYKKGNISQKKPAGKKGLTPPSPPPHPPKKEKR